MQEQILQQIFDRTGGRCHFCGDALEFEKRGRGGGALGVDDVPSGYWEVDHVNHVSRGGRRHGTNCLAACVGCNRLRWHRRGAYVRTTLRLGLVARDKIKDAGHTGRELLQAAMKRWPRSTDWSELGARRRYGPKGRR
jgi:HNH endonuclease